MGKRTWIRVQQVRDQIVTKVRNIKLDLVALRITYLIPILVKKEYQITALKTICGRK